MTMLSDKDVIQFWFHECTVEDWFGGKAEFDARLKERFHETFEHVARGEGWTWRTTPEGRLAEVIVLDQFSRQFHRGEPQAFAQDGMALVLAQEAVAGGHDMAVPLEWRVFFYMPYMHSESLAVHEAGRPLFEALGDEKTLQFELDHAEVVRRFGRFPKRNAALGRESTPEEAAYIAEVGDRMF
ncbi:membrane protein [Youhaiella tibetensis]|nr:DUF924 family protein [Youhaiella tibetensis]AKR58457.1 membrane protein [Devosia sp. H5989]GGF34238.1 membrane protein [Youhaiella tibetensis]